MNPDIGLLFRRADLDLLSSGSVLLRGNLDGVPLLVVHSLGQLGDAEELIHLLKSQTLWNRELARDLAQGITWLCLTLVSGTRNQTKMNMLKQKQEKVMNAP